jgi:hypothetical protein
MQIVFGRDFVDRLDSPRGLQGHPGLEIRGETSSVLLLHGSRSKSAENAPTLKPQIQSSPWLHPPGPPLKKRQALEQSHSLIDNTRALNDKQNGAAIG